MTPWVLLFMTAGCAYLTYDAFRWTAAVKRAPFGVIAKLWKGGLSHLSLPEQAELRQRYSSTSSGAGQICWVFLAATISLAVATVRAFLS
jgi:hypothetical protein